MPPGSLSMKNEGWEGAGTEGKTHHPLAWSPLGGAGRPPESTRPARTLSCPRHPVGERRRETLPTRRKCPLPSPSPAVPSGFSDAPKALLCPQIRGPHHLTWGWNVTASKQLGVLRLSVTCHPQDLPLRSKGKDRLSAQSCGQCGRDLKHRSLQQGGQHCQALGTDSIARGLGLGPGGTT